MWAAGLFLLTLIVRLPLRWVASALPAAIQCEIPSGTIWSGHCARAGSAPFLLSDVSWSLRPWLLFTGRLGATVHSGDARAPLQADLRAGFGGRIELRDLQGSIAIGSGLLPLFPDGWSGTLHLEISEAKFRDARPQRILGVARVTDLRRRGANGELGSYQLQFHDADDAGGTIGGDLHDTAGPLAVSAHLVLAPDGSYELSGTVLARNGAPADLAASVAALGAPDATGRRPFSLAGTL
jgi:general secretion pathway protein N